MEQYDQLLWKLVAIQIRQLIPIEERYNENQIADDSSKRNINRTGNDDEKEQNRRPRQIEPSLEKQEEEVQMSNNFVGL